MNQIINELERLKTEVRRLRGRLDSISVGNSIIVTQVTGTAQIPNPAQGALIRGNATPKWERLAASVPAASLRNVVGLDNGDTVPAYKALLDSTNPTTQDYNDAPNPGASLIAARRDHLHGMPAAGGSAASTTEVLTGTDATKFATPDAIAALWEQGGNITSAGTISVGEGGFFRVTGTTTITDIDFDITKAGRLVWLLFEDALILTHNGTTLILPTGANITTEAGDIAVFISEGGDNVRCAMYMRADGAPLVGGGGAPDDYPYLGFGTNGGLTAEVDVEALVFQNEVMNFPSIERADDVKPEWWDQSANALLTEVDVVGESITETFKRCLKVVTTNDNHHGFQRLTYADQPRVKSGRKLSIIAKVWSVSAVAARIRLITSAATAVVSGDTTTAGWTTLKANNLTLDGTFVDIQLEVDSGTAYFAEITVMVGVRAVPLGPRGLAQRWVDAATVIKSLSGLGDEDTWTDIDCTASTSPLAAMLHYSQELFDNTSGDQFRLYARRNGDTAAKGSGNLIGIVNGAGGSIPQSVDDQNFIVIDAGQIFEYLLDRTSGTGTLSFGEIRVKSFLEWE
jgi:hypothetical protein